MNEPPTRAASWMAVALCVVLAVGSLFLHPDAGNGGLHLKYPLLGAGAVVAVVILVRILRPLLRTSDGDNHAD